MAALGWCRPRRLACLADTWKPKYHPQMIQQIHCLKIFCQEIGSHFRNKTISPKKSKGEELRSSKYLVTAVRNKHSIHTPALPFTGGQFRGRIRNASFPEKGGREKEQNLTSSLAQSATRASELSAREKIPPRHGQGWEGRSRRTKVCLFLVRSA